MYKTLFGMAVVGLCLSFNASALVYSYSIDDPHSNDYGQVGEIRHFGATYSDENQQLTFTSTISEATADDIDLYDWPAGTDETPFIGNLPNGFWLVLSNGPNPKDNHAEYAILYGDALTGTLTAYQYDTSTAHHGSESWTQSSYFIQSIQNAVTYDTSVDGQVTMGFSIDATIINSWSPILGPGVIDAWTGSAFDDNIGIWFHPSMFQGDGATYNPDGSIATFDALNGTWFDIGGENTVGTEPNGTNTVSAPQAIWLVLFGLIGSALINRLHLRQSDDSLPAGTSI